VFSKFHLFVFSPPPQRRVLHACLSSCRFLDPVLEGGQRFPHSLAGLGLQSHRVNSIQKPKNIISSFVPSACLRFFISLSRYSTILAFRRYWLVESIIFSSPVLSEVSSICQRFTTLRTLLDPLRLSLRISPFFRFRQQKFAFGCRCLYFRSLLALPRGPHEDTQFPERS